MNYLHENDTDNRTLQDVIDAIDAGEGYDLIAGKTCASIKPDTGRLGNSIPILTEWESYLTASEISALWDSDIMTTPRNSLLPESKEWMIILGRFLESLQESDFDRGAIVNFDQPQNHTLTLEEKFKLTFVDINDRNLRYRIILYPNSKFTINTIENVSVKCYSQSITNTHDIGFIADKFDSPINPYYKGNNPSKAKALKLRASVYSIVDMIMDRHNEPDDRIHFIGMRFRGWSETFRYCKDVLPPMVRRAWLDGLKETRDHLQGNHDGGQSDMSQFIPYGFFSYSESEDPSLNRINLEKYRSQTQTNDSNQKMNGHCIDHDGGIDHSYMGIATNPRTGELAFTDGDESYVLNMLDRWHEYLGGTLLPEPVLSDNRMLSQTAYNVGTSRGYERPQWWEDFRGKIIAYYVPSAQFMAYDWRSDGNKGLTDEAGIDSYINSSTNWGSTFMWERNSGSGSAMGFNSGNELQDDPPDWSQEHWRTHYGMWYEFAPSDLYAVLSARKDLSSTYLLEADNDSIKVPFLKSGNFVETFGEEALFAKINNWGTQIFSPDTGYRGGEDGSGAGVGNYQISGVFTGLASFWTKETGAILLSVARYLQGSTVPKLTLLSEGTNWELEADSGWDSSFHSYNTIWMLKDDGSPFSPAIHHRNFNYTGASVTYTVNSQSDFDAVIEGNLNPMRWGYDPLSGTVDFSYSYSGDTTGLEVTETITSNEGDNITEMWKYLPLVHSAAGETSTFEVDTGSGLVTATIGSTINGVERIRVTRYSNSVDIIPDATEHPNGWDLIFDTLTDFYDEANVRLVKIDLHPNTGNSVTIPTSTTCKYRIEPV